MEEHVGNTNNETSVKTKNNTLVVGLIVVVAVAAFFAGLYVSNLNSDQVTKKEVEEAMAKLELKILQDRLNPSQRPAVEISTDDDPVRGNANAPITIIEFSDFQCPFCARFHIQTLPLILDEYINTGKVKLVYRDFPIQGAHPNAMPAAVAAECADEQKRFWEYHDMLFERQNQWNKLEAFELVSMFTQYAGEIELNIEQFSDCLNIGRYVSEIQKDLDDGRNYGITGTPGFFVGNADIGFVEVKGAQPFENFKKIIDAQLIT